MSERALMAWLEDNDPFTATALNYCVTAEEMRAVMNMTTGMEIEPDSDVDEACGRWLAALKAKR